MVDGERMGWTELSIIRVAGRVGAQSGGGAKGGDLGPQMVGV